MIATVTLNPSLDEWMRLPSLRLGALNRATGFARYPGGKGINVSRVVAELGGRTIAFGLAGGEDGLILRELINRLGLRHDFIPIEGTTRNNYKLLTQRPRTVTEINMVGPRVSHRALQVLEHHLLTRRPAPTWVALCGSVPPGVPATIYRTWMQRLHHRGIRTALDTSGAALRHGMVSHPSLVKPNRDEAQELLGIRLDRTRHYVQALRALIRMGVEHAILSLGADGALMGRGDDVWFAASPSVRVRSTVGAGDSLVGGWLTSWERGWSIEETLRLAVASGAATVMTTGTELCHRADVLRLFRRVRVRRLA